MLSFRFNPTQWRPPFAADVDLSSPEDCSKLTNRPRKRHRRKTPARFRHFRRPRLGARASALTAARSTFTLASEPNVVSSEPLKIQVITTAEETEPESAWWRKVTELHANYGGWRFLLQLPPPTTRSTSIICAFELRDTELLITHRFSPRLMLDVEGMLDSSLLGRLHILSEFWGLRSAAYFLRWGSLFQTILRANSKSPTLDSLMVLDGLRRPGLIGRWSAFTEITTPMIVSLAMDPNPLSLEERALIWKYLAYIFFKALPHSPEAPRAGEYGFGA